MSLPASLEAVCVSPAASAFLRQRSFACRDGRGISVGISTTTIYSSLFSQHSATGI